jgi:DNA polymerase (family 10)
MANGMNEARVLAQIKEIRKAEKEMDGFRIFAGSEVDIHQDGSLDLDDEVLAQLDVVVASVHSHMNLPAEEMTERLLRAFENPHLKILGHPTGRLEINSFPDRLDLRDHAARLAHERGAKLVISTDSHHTKHLDHIRYGVLLARRAWLEKQDVLNTLPASEFLHALRQA